MKKLYKKSLFVLFAFLVIGFAAGRARAAENTTAEQIIVSVTEARVRMGPSLRGKILGATKLGSVYEVLDNRQGWYKISFNAENDGWIYGGIVEKYDDSSRGQIYQRLADKYLKRPNLDFDTAAELFEFLNRIQPEVADTSVTADLAYKHLLALAAALEKIPIDKQEQNPYKLFTDTYTEQIAYSEPAGQYAVRAQLWWDLRESFSLNPLADEMAWEGAKTLIPGECEGYVPCHLYVVRETDGKYLEFYPNGKHAREALKNLSDSLGFMAEQAPNPAGYYITEDPDDRVQLEKHVAELRAIISKVPGTAKTKILSDLDKIEAGYQPEEFDESSLDEFWLSFRAAVIDENKTVVADMTRFPLSMPYGHNDIKTRAEFIRNYDKIMNLMTDAAKCFQKATLSKENGRYGVYCGFKDDLDDEDNKPNYYYFEKTSSGWKLVGIDNINE